MRIGVAEVGSRSVRLMVADFKPDGTFKAARTASFLHGVKVEALLDEDVLQLWSKLDEYRREITDLDCDRVMIYGTALCRTILEKRPNALPTYLKVLSVDEEALASWAAGFMCLRGPSTGRKVTVLDQGGGSTEVISATWTDRGPTNVASDSLDIGSNRILDIFLSSKENYAQMLHGIVADYGPPLKRHSASDRSVLYLLGSVATKLAWLKVRRDATDAYKPHLVNDVPLTLSDMLERRTRLDRLYKQNVELARQYVDSRSGSEDEAPRIISGSAFLMLIAVKLGYQLVRVSGYGIRHGMAYLVVNGLINPDGRN